MAAEGTASPGDAVGVGVGTRKMVSCIGSGVVPRLLGDLDASGSGSRAYIFSSASEWLLVIATVLAACMSTRGGLLVHSRSSDPSKDNERKHSSLLRSRYESIVPCASL